LRYGLSLVSEGLAGEILEEILAVLLYMSKANGLAFLKQCIAAEALLSIAIGEDIDVMFRKLVPYCGIDETFRAMNLKENTNKKEAQGELENAD